MSFYTCLGRRAWMSLAVVLGGQAQNESEQDEANYPFLF